MERIRPTGQPQGGSSAPAPRPGSSRPSISSKVLVTSLVVIGVVLLIAMSLIFFRDKMGGASVAKDQYQAVFLSNGQVYFGRLSNVGSDYATLEDIFYLQVQQQQQQQLQEGENSAEADPQISLAKLGNELHGPEDKMFISSDQILFWENLKNEGDVVTAIQDYQENGDQEGTQDVNQGQQQTQPADGVEPPTQDEE